MDTHQRIREAAISLFSEKGFAATGIREIAARAGIRTASMYHYFGTKEDILLRIMEENLDRLIKVSRRIVDDSDDPLWRLCSLVKMHVWIHGQRRLSAMVTDNELRSLNGHGRDQIVILRDTYEQTWREVIGHGLAARLFRISNPKLTVFALLGMCNGVSHWYSPEGSLDLDAVGTEYAQMALRMVGVTPARAARLDPATLPAAAVLYRNVVGVEGSE